MGWPRLLRIAAGTASTLRIPIAALEDPNRLEDFDTRFEDGEERIRAIGMAVGTVLFVVMTCRSERTCRIISARRATRHEQDRYYAEDREIW